MHIELIRNLNTVFFQSCERKILIKRSVNICSFHPKYNDKLNVTAIIFSPNALKYTLIYLEIP